MGAVISACGSFRYLLTRPATQAHPGASTADAENDDSTIRKCRGFAERWDCNGITVANLYAFRATKPADMKAAIDAIGPDNDAWLRRLAYEHDDVVFAWGAHADADRASEVVRIFKNEGCRMFCLGTNKDGSPKHPLYIRYEQPLLEFKP
jgi:hypothetical protein